MKFKFLLSLIIISFCSGAQSEQKLFPFTTDGCSMFLDSKWLHCCIEHDKKYWIGGTREEKKIADQELKQCVRSTDNPKTSFLMYRGVRIGGSASLPTTFHWGYGWKEKRGYGEFSKDELDQINKYKVTTELPKLITTGITNIVAYKTQSIASYCNVVDLQKNLLEEFQRNHSIESSYATNIEVAGSGYQYRVQVFTDQCVNGFYIVEYNLNDSCQIDKNTVNVQSIGECTLEKVN